MNNNRLTKQILYNLAALLGFCQPADLSFPVSIIKQFKGKGKGGRLSFALKLTLPTSQLLCEM